MITTVELQTRNMQEQKEDDKEVRLRYRGVKYTKLSNYKN